MQRDKKEFPPKFDHLDFSKFHDLMHPIWRCRDPLLHIKYWWLYMFQPEKKFRTNTFCRLGRHVKSTAWSKTRGEFSCCLWCWKPL